jgi:hypothetical protein
MTSNSSTLLTIAKWCFLFVAVWYAMTCLYTLNDTEVWVEGFEPLHTMWDVRALLGLLSLFLWGFCELVVGNE